MTRINVYSLRQVKESGGLYEIGDKKITAPGSAQAIINMVLDLNNESVEKFGIITLNTKNYIAGIHVISVGSLNSTIVHPREVFKAAILNNAASIVLFHNHPSGDPEPSSEDVGTTQRLVEAGEMLNINVLDHVIIGECGRYVSFKERGLV